ncbi:tlde1 domain-containing protein [Erwinia sp. DT-104]|uniref:tlde1 domain-containing protein n=1 Tax=Erwinia sp. DT-104 TaxID=3396161 RepID=UPI003F19E081
MFPRAAKRGAGEQAGCRNDIAFECLKYKGPLPRGRYHIERPEAVHRSAGKYVLRLPPLPGNSMCNRDGFLIQDDNGKGTASTGCIVSLIIGKKLRTAGIRS